MKKIAAFILLLCHVNFSMFLPQVAECDSFDKNGQQVDDVNSLAEYAGILLGYDSTADDEDSDGGECLHLDQDDYFHPLSNHIAFHGIQHINSHSFVEYLIHQPDSPSYDIIAPPPEA